VNYAISASQDLFGRMIEEGESLAIMYRFILESILRKDSWTSIIEPWRRWVRVVQQVCLDS
jgi:hypothetical protein